MRSGRNSVTLFLFFSFLMVFFVNSFVLAQNTLVDYFYFTPDDIQAGQKTVLKWKVSRNPSRVWIDHGIGDVSAQGSVKLFPEATALYHIKTWDSDGNLAHCQTCEIWVNPRCPQLVTLEFSPETVRTGEATTLKWKALYASKVVFDNGIGEQPPEGEITFYPNESKGYFVQCYDAAGNPCAQGSLNIAVVPRLVINWFTATPSTIGVGGTTTLSWSVSGAKRLAISIAGSYPFYETSTDVNTGSYQFKPESTNTYSLDVSNERDNSFVELTVNVQGEPQLVYFKANPENIVKGDSSLLSFEQHGATNGYLVGDEFLQPIEVDPGGGLHTNENIEVTPDKSTRYKIFIENDDGNFTGYTNIYVTNPSEASDLSVSLPTSAPANAFSSQIYHLEFAVRNDGKADAESFDIEILVNGEVAKTITSNAIAIGKARIFEEDILLNKVGKNKIDIVVDGKGVNADFDRKNNKTSLAVSTKLAKGVDLVPVDIKFSPAPVEGQFIYSFKVYNIGKKKAKPFSVSVKIAKDENFEVQQSMLQFQNFPDKLPGGEFVSVSGVAPISMSKFYLKIHVDEAKINKDNNPDNNTYIEKLRKKYLK